MISYDRQAYPARRQIRPEAQAGAPGQAAIAIEENNRKLAITKFQAVATDEDLPAPYRDLATIRQTAMEFDTLKPEQIIARMLAVSPRTVQKHLEHVYDRLGMRSRAAAAARAVAAGGVPDPG